MNTSTVLDETMNAYFMCKSGQNVSWTSVCDGRKHCKDGSDEQSCFCQGDVYTCLAGNNVSCRFACEAYGRVTCLTYTNTRACEQYFRERSSIHPEINSAGDSSLSTDSFDALRYSAFLAGGILLFVSIVSLIIYIIRKNPSQLFLFCSKRSLRSYLTGKSTNRLTSESSILQQQQQQQPTGPPTRPRYTPAPDILDLPPSYYATRQQTTMNDCYEPPPYPGPPLFSSVQRSDSIYYESIKSPSTSNSMSMLHPMPLPEPRAHANARTHRV